MSVYDQIVQIRVNEAIEEGLKSQYYHRNMPQKKKSVSKVMLIFICLGLFIACTLGNCSVAQNIPSMTAPISPEIVESINLSGYPDTRANNTVLPIP